MPAADTTTLADSAEAATEAEEISDVSIADMFFDDAQAVSISIGLAAVGEKIGTSSPAMQRFTAEELRDCPVEECITAQWDQGSPEAGSFELSEIGTHFFDLEPKEFNGEPGNETIKVRKFMTPTSEVVAEVEHLTIVSLLDEGIGPKSKWCKVKIRDLEHATDSYNVTGFVNRQHLQRIESGVKCWEGPTTLPSPKYVAHRNRKKPKWKLGVPWYTRLACEPWLDEKELKYKTMVNTGHKNREVMDMLTDDAIRIGIKQLMVYYDRLPKNYDVHTLDNGVAHLQQDLYQFAKVEKTFVSPRPGDSVKALVTVNLSHLLAVPRMVRTFTTATEIRTGHRTVIYQSNTMEKKLKKVAVTMERIQTHVDMFPGTIRGSQRFSPQKQAKNIRKFVPSLKKLFKNNGYDLRKNHEDLIEIGTDNEFNPTHVIVYPDDTGVGMPQTIGFNSYASQLPVSSDRLMHYILQGNNMFSDAKMPAMQSLSPPWMSYLTKYTYPALEIRPTPPSGLGLGNLPNFSDLGNIANQFNSLPIKGPKDLAFENLKLMDPSFLANMALARVDFALPSGDNLVANLPDILDKIHSLDDVYAELLQKISIPKLIEQAMAKLMAALGLDNIYAALLQAALGQFSVDMLIKQFLMELPDDIFTDLLEQLLDSLDVSCDDLINLMVGMGIQTDHLQGIIDQVGDEMSALQDQLDTFNSLLPAVCDTTGAEVDTSLDEDLEETGDSIQNSLENVLANLTCDDLKLIIKNIAFNGVPTFDFEPPTIDLSCYVKDIELAMGAILLPFMIPLTGFPIDVTRLGEIDWSGLTPGVPNINIMTPDGSFINIGDLDGWADLDMGDLPGFSMPDGGFNPAIAAPNLNFPELVLGGIDGSLGDLSASPGGIQMPNIKLSEALSDLEFPGGIEVLIEIIGGLPDGAIPGLSLDGLGPTGGASLPDLGDIKFGELLDDWRRLFIEAFSGFLLSNFVFTIAGGGGAFSKLRARLDGFDWGTPGATIVIPDGDLAIPDSTLPNIPDWDASGIQTRIECPPPGVTPAVEETTGIGWQTLATMPREWWEASVDGSDANSVLTIPDYAGLLAQINALDEDAQEALATLRDAIDGMVNFDLAAGFEPCEFFKRNNALYDALEDLEFRPDVGEYSWEGDYNIHISDILVPTAIFRPSVGCGTFRFYGFPDFGLGGMSLPLPIAGPNGDETFDIFDLDQLLSKLPEIPNFPDILPEVSATDIGLDASILCNKPDLFIQLADLMAGDIPTVPSALAQLDGIIKGLEFVEGGAPGTAGGVPTKKILLALFRFIVDKLGFDPMIVKLSDILKKAMSAGDLTVDMLKEIPAIRDKFDILISAMPSMPTFSPPALGGLGGGGMPKPPSLGSGGAPPSSGDSSPFAQGSDAPTLEAPPTSLPGGGMPGGTPGGSSAGGGSVASMAAKFTIPTITLPDNIPTGDLMGAMFSGMQDSVKSGIESAIVEMGKSIIRSLLDSASDGTFGDLDIGQMLADALGAALALDVINSAFENMGVDENGKIVTTTETTIEIEMGCGEPYEVDLEDPEDSCPPADFVAAISAKLTKPETIALLHGFVSPRACGFIEDVIRDSCPAYAVAFTDCGKVAETFEAIGAFIPEHKKEDDAGIIPLARDLRSLCCGIEDRGLIRARLANPDLGLTDEEIEDEIQTGIDEQVEALAALAMQKMQLPEGFPFTGDGHGGTIVPDVWPCEETCPTEEPPKPSLFPPDNEIPTLDFMNRMATDLMYEPLNYAFKMEASQYPEILVSGTVRNTPVPFWDAANTHMQGGSAGISRFAEQLFNQGAVLCKEDGSLWGESSYDNKLGIVRAVLATIEDGEDNDGEEWGLSDFKDLHVLQQQNSGAVVPVLYNSLQQYDYVRNVWDRDSETYAWHFQYGGAAETPTGDKWPTVTWKMNPVSAKQLSTSQPPPASTTTSVPSTYQTPLGKDCDEYSATTSEDMDSAGVELEEGLPLKYQLFRQFMRDKFLKHPRILDGVDVASLESWGDLGLGGRGVGVGFGFKDVYQQVINQTIQGAGIQITFTDLFDTETLKLLEIEPTSMSPPNHCGDPPKSVLDLEESGKKLTKDSFMQACKSPELEKETGKNALKQAGLVGCVEMTVRAYVIDTMLRSIFPLSEYNLVDFDGVFLQQIADKMHREMKILDPRYETTFMDQTKELLRSMCEAAKCKDEPLTDPMTGEELEDCDNLDALMYFIKKHLTSVAEILDEKFGSSTPNVSKRALKSWLTTLPLPEYPIPDNMDVSGMMSQADLYHTILNNPRPEVSLEGFTTYYTNSTAAETDSSTGGEVEGEAAVEVPATYTEMDVVSVNSGEFISSLLPDNLPLPRLFTFSETSYSSTDLEYVGKEVILFDPAATLPVDPEDPDAAAVSTVTLEASWQQVDDPVASFLNSNPQNNLYYSLTKNWYYPGHSSYPTPEEFPTTTDVKGGLYLEKFIKIGDEYWNADNLQEWFERLMVAATKETPDPMAIFALARYSITEAHYGMRLCYMYPTKTNAGGTLTDNTDLLRLLNSMFGTSMGVLPDVGRMQGSFIQPEAVIFNQEVNSEIPAPSITATEGSETDSETTTGEESDESSGAATVTASGIEAKQKQFFNFSIPLVEVTISAGNPITAAIDETLGDTIDAADAAMECEPWDLECLEAAARAAAEAVEDLEGTVTSYRDAATASPPDIDAIVAMVTEYKTPWTDAPAALDEKLKDLQKKLRKHDDWRFIFRQCMHSGEIVQSLWNYCAMMTTVSVPGIEMSFSETKSELRKLFWILYHDIGTGGDGFSFDAASQSTSMEIATINTDTDGGGLPLPIKMAMMTIPMLFKGIAETIDPNIMIAKLIRVAADGDQGKIPKVASTLMALPFNLIPPPPFGPGIGPPITPIGLAYLALGALTPMEKQNMRMSKVANPPAPPPDATGTDADCNTSDEEADE
jgi:hypothetical protein